MNSTYSLSITRLGGLGDGSGTHEGKSVFVAKSAIGDVLTVREISRIKDSARAEIISIDTASPDRIAAPCPHYEACGGCSLQHLSASAYQQFKRDVVKTAQSYGGFPDIEPNFHFLPSNTRRRADFKIENGKLCYLGFKSHERIAIATCLILLPELKALITPLNKLLPQFPLITGLQITRADSGIDILLHLVSSDGGLNQYKAIAEALPIIRLSAKFPSGSIQVIAQEDMVLMKLGDADVPIPADAFLQASAEAQRIITNLVVQATKGISPIVDLFSGIGTYSFPMSERARVTAVENNGPMVDHIQSISPKVRAIKRDLFLKPLPSEELQKYKAAVINPPRAGADAQTKQLAKSGIPTIVMISCNHSTWSRDAKTLKLEGYQLQSLDVVDQFVYSPHLELVSIFHKA